MRIKVPDLRIPPIVRATNFGALRALRWLLVPAVFWAAAGQISYKRAPFNFDERKVPPYTLPDPLLLTDGSRVTDAMTWHQKRRPELLQLFSEDVFGVTPTAAFALRTSPVVTERKALKDKAIRKQLTVYFTDENAGPQMHLLLYLPAHATAPSPVLLALNISGNQAVLADPGILTHDIWVSDPADFSNRPDKPMLHIPPDDRSRGAESKVWEVEKLIDRGYGLCTVYYGDIEPDFAAGMARGVRPGLTPTPADWSAIGAWSWGLSRALDYLLTDKTIDPHRIGVIGHGVTGKAALWAAAQDGRFGLAIADESGKGGAAPLKRGFGETVDHLNTTFPAWFCAHFRDYDGHTEKLPVDMNELLALIAPAPLYISSAAEDLASDPRGEFLAAASASRVYQLLGKKGLGTNQMPVLNQPVLHDVSYNVRAGQADITAFDWDQYLAFADMEWGAPK